MNSTQTEIRRLQKGVTLIELMVAMLIGSILLIGAVTVFSDSRATFRTSDIIARLQENARFALDTIEPDIRQAARYLAECTGCDKKACNHIAGVHGLSSRYLLVPDWSKSKFD